MTMHLTRPDFVVIFGYFALVLLIGVYFRRQQKTAGDYFAGGHQVPWWLAGISHYMSGFSAFTLVVYSEIAYRYGGVAIVLFWTSVPACLLGGRVFAARWRRARIITPVEFLEERCSLTVRQLFAWSAIPAKVFEDGLKIFTTALFLSAGMGIGLRTSVLACGAIVVVYTILGGLLALVVTDYLQFLMKALAILLLLPLAVWRLGGLKQTWHAAPPQLWHAHGGPYGWLYILSYLLIVCISYNGNWSFAQKFYSVPDEASARKVGYLAAALNFVGTPIMLVPAVLANQLLPDFAVQQKPQDVYVHLIFGLLPAGMIGIIVAALFSATMATVSADLNAIASVLTKDFYQRILRPAASERTLVSAGRIITLLIGLVIVTVSFWLTHTSRGSLFHIMVTAFGVLLAPTLLPLLATLLFRRMTSKGVIVGFICGLVSGTLTLGAKVLLLQHAGAGTSQEFDYELEALSILVNITATCVGMLVGSHALVISEDEKQKTEAFFLKLATPVALQKEPVSQRNGRSSNNIIRLSTIAIGLLLVISGTLATSHAARWMDVTIGVLLLVFSIPFLQVLRRTA